MLERCLYAVLKVCILAQWLSWLERRPVTAEVVSSSLIRVVKSDCVRDLSVLAQRKDRT